MGGGGGHPPPGSEMGKGGIAADAADAREEEFKAHSLPSLSFCARSCNRTVSEGGREEALPMRRILAVSKAPFPLMRHRKSDGRAPLLYTELLFRPFPFPIPIPFFLIPPGTTTTTTTFFRLIHRGERRSDC